MDHQPTDHTQPGPGEDGPEPAATGRSARVPIIVGVSLLVAGVLGAGAYAGSQLVGGGPQPAEALPDTVIAYAAIDIDPGAKQKVQAIRTLRKFPELKKAMDVEEDDDLRKRLFDEAIEGSGCEDEISFSQDVEPWLGDRLAVGAADLGEQQPSPVIALQVSDEDEAEKGFDKLRSCGDDAGPGSDFSHAFNEGYLLISDGKDHAQQLAEAAGTSSLADDEDFGDWSDQAGGDGIITFYVSQQAADMIVEMMPPEVAGQARDLDRALEEFKGMAGALRFADGGVELEVAAEGGQDVIGEGTLGDSLTGLPGDTAVAVGFGVPDDFASTMMDQLEGVFGRQADQMTAEVEAQTGLELPDDLETLLGDAVLVALGGEAPERMQDTEGPADVPFGLKIVGDPEEIQKVVAKAEERAGQQLSDADLVQDTDKDAYVLASNEAFAATLKKKGDLGDSEAFAAVVPEGGDSSFALFVDFDSAWRDTIVSSIRESGSADEAGQVDANTEPLGALGISGWRDGAVSHALVKITTD